MKKKRKLTPQEVQIYHKQHDYEDVLTAEESKIRNEKDNYARLQQKSKLIFQQKIKWLITAIDPDASEDDLDISEEELVANRIIRNARTHKNRLHGLRDYEDD